MNGIENVVVFVLASVLSAVTMFLATLRGNAAAGFGVLVLAILVVLYLVERRRK